MGLNAAQLATVNNLIANSDSWSYTNNCSEFAQKIWNAVSSVKVDNGTLNTPTALRNSIMSKSGYTSGLGFSQSYAVYYANGTGTPIRSTTWN